MAFHPELWANAIAACYPTPARPNVHDTWLAHRTYFFDMYPTQAEDGKTPQVPVRLFENFYPVYAAMADIIEELLDDEPDMSWTPLVQIWQRIRPLWQEFETIAGAHQSLLTLDRDDEGIVSINAAAMNYPLQRIADLLDAGIVFDMEPPTGSHAEDLMLALALPDTLLSMLRPWHTGRLDAHFETPALEARVADLLTQMIYQIRDLYTWLHLCRINRGDRLLASVKRL